MFGTVNLKCTVAGWVIYGIAGGNDNGGLPAFSIDASTGVVSTASAHNYEVTARQDSVNISMTVNSTAPYYKGNLTSYTIVTFNGE